MATTIDNPTGRDLVLAVVGAHAGALLALARRHSLCADDAHDAYQRAMEIFLQRADSLDPKRAASWLRTVVKNEAIAVREARQRIVGPLAVDFDRSEARDLLPVDERAACAERDGRSAEALARLKPQEVRALVLKAHGYSYREICEITGWTYTKVNRCLAEGRRAFLDRFADIEAGRECARWEGMLSALADGEATPADVAAVRPHLRHCPPCRARLREFRGAPRAVAAVAPAAAVLASGDRTHAAAASGLLSRVHDAVVSGWHERVVLSAHKVQAGVEAASAGKLAAVAASATALAGGGAAALTDVAERPPEVRRAAATAPVRTQAPAEKSPGDPVARSPTAPSPAAADPVPAAREETTAQPPAPDPPAEFDVGAGSPTPPPTPRARGPRAAPSRPSASPSQPEFGP